MTVKYNEYYDKLVEYGIIKITAMAIVHETTQTWMGEDDFQVIKPILKVEVSFNYKNNLKNKSNITLKLFVLLANIQVINISYILKNF